VEQIQEDVTQHDMKEAVRDVHSRAHSALQIINRLNANIRCRSNECAAGFPPYRE
jgi:hypothetical protein